ncbi:hypothetical protein ACJRO7_016982 [Eucalyptus globulus]|uniref:tRNA pseudouridine synthase n=1 Tax=Eucalyptus globulus TaxID=34317 RepID=A0ABD3KV10_EUCGL
MSTSPNADSVDALRSQIHSLQTTINELEKQNADLSPRLSGCCCQKMEDKIGCVVEGGRVVDGNGKSTKLDKKTRKKKDFKTGILEHHARRYVALRLMYFGQRFYGFASEAQLDPTVESEIFKALEKTKLLVGDKKKSQYSRCGRTERSFIFWTSKFKNCYSTSKFLDGSVISLFLRSNLRPKNTDDANNWGLSIDRDVLPKDIRVTGWCPVPIDFSASREYKYFFWRDNLDIRAMESAGQKFVGDNDFRNFCKMDAFIVHNYKRHITSFELSSCDKRYVLDIFLPLAETPGTERVQQVYTPVLAVALAPVPLRHHSALYFKGFIPPTKEKEKESGNAAGLFFTWKRNELFSLHRTTKGKNHPLISISREAT